MGSRHRQDELVLPVHARRHWDYDEAGTHILIDGEINGQPRKLITHSARNGFLYTMERSNGQTLLAKPYLDNVNWTKGIDQKTGKPLDYDPNKDMQIYAGAATPTAQDPTKKMCPSPAGGNNFWPSSYSQKTKLIYIPALSTCALLTRDPALSNKAGDWKGGAYKQTERYETDLTVADPLTGEIKKNVHMPYPNYSGALTTGGRRSCSPASPTAPSPPTTTPPWSSSGRSTSAPASTRRR